MNSSEQLEREAEETRGEIAEALGELRSRMTPGRMFDQAFDYARESGGAEFLHNLRRQVVNNPLPLAVMSMGMAWLAMSSRHGPNGRGRSGGQMSGDWPQYAGDGGSTSAAQRARELGHRAGETAAEYGDSARETASDYARRANETMEDYRARIGEAASEYGERAKQMGESARETMSRAGASVRSGAESVADTASAAYDSAASTYRSGVKSTRRAAHDLVNSSRSLMDYLQENPLMLAGVGLALGAAIGAILPETRAENELMGKASDDLKERTAALAREQVEKGEALAKQAWDGAKSEAEQQSVSSETSSHDGGSQRHREVPPDEASLIPSEGETLHPEPHRS